MSALRRNVWITEILEEDADEVLLRLLANDNEQPFHWPPAQVNSARLSDGSAEAETQATGGVIFPSRAPPPLSM